jgi:isocitrate/isopropylmalate dehydrogenase
MLLEHAGQQAAAKAVEQAVAKVLASGEAKTPDLGGQASTRDVTDAVIAALG